MPYGISDNQHRRGRNDIIYFSEKLLGVKLHNGQKKFLRNVLNTKYYLLCPANQWGKSVSLAVLHIYCAFYKVNMPGWTQPDRLKDFDKLPYKTLYLSPRLRQARAVYGYIVSILQSQFSWTEVSYYTARNPKDWRKKSERCNRKFKVNDCQLDFLVKPHRVPNNQLISTTPVQFKNSSQVHLVPTGSDRGSGLAGDQFPLITYDECSSSHHLEEEVAGYIYSRTLKFNAPIVLVGTPDVESESFEYYNRLLMMGEEDKQWQTQIGLTTDNKFYDKKELERQKQMMEKLDPVMARQVFYGEFVGTRSSFFLKEEVGRLFNESNEFHEPQKKRHYVIGADFAVAQNYTVYICVDVTGEQWDIVKFIRFKGNTYSPAYQFELLKDMAKEYNNAEVAFDASSLAGPMIEHELHRLDTYANKFTKDDKQELLLALKKALSYNKSGRFRAPEPTKQNGLKALRRELHSYKEKDQRLTKDCVMALGLVAWRMWERETEGQVAPFEDFDILRAPLLGGAEEDHWNKSGLF